MMTNWEARAREAIRTLGPIVAYRSLLAENDAMIQGPGLETGREIVTARTAIHSELIGHWAAEQQRAFGYTRPFAVVAVGGTGRGEVTPCSDTDFAFLFDDAIEGNPFLLELQRRILHTTEFADTCGFSTRPLPFNLDDATRLAGDQLNSFLDMRPVYDPTGLADRFRDRIRATFAPFDHFLHVRAFWKNGREAAAGAYERLDRFDIKNDGLRVFLAGIWTLAGKQFLHSHEVYQVLEDPRDLQAYDLLLRIRCFVHSRRARPRETPNDEKPDVLTFDDFIAFGEMLGPEASERARFEFANEVRARLLAARRRVARFTKAVIEHELRQGRSVRSGGPIVYGLGGLFHTTSRQCLTPRDKSRAALSLLLASQRFGVPIDPAEFQGTFRNAGDWLAPVPELAALFYEPRGSLATSFTFLAQFEGAEDRLFPGYARFEASLDGRVMTQRQSLRSVLEREKVRILETYVATGLALLANAISPDRRKDVALDVSPPVEAALLDADHLAAVKLALKTKRLPLTADDRRVRADESRPWPERFSTGMSEIPLEEYYQPYLATCEFSPETLRLTEFLVANRRAFKERAEVPLADDRQVSELAVLAGDEHRLRSLFVFTCVDRAEWESEKDDPERWFHTRELYRKTMLRFRPGADPIESLITAGYAPEQLEVLRDFGAPLFAGEYRRHAGRLTSHLLRLAEDPTLVEPKVSLLREGAGTIVGVAARDYRGLAATITGALWRAGVDVRLAHLFSAPRFGLALDFFHIAPGVKSPGRELVEALERAVRDRLHIGDEDAERLPRITGQASLWAWDPGRCCLRFDTAQERSGLIYALTYQVYRQLGGNISALTAKAERGNARVAIYLGLPEGLTFAQAQTIVAGWSRG